MTQPPLLRPGDKIGICAPARKISQAEILPCLTQIRAWGYEVVQSSYLFSEHHQFAGTDDIRIQAVNEMFADPTIRAIIFARGGYGCHRVIEHLDWEPLVLNPKWLIGFSDTTLLAGAAFRKNILSIHGPLGICFGWPNYEANIQALKNIISEDPSSPMLATAQKSNRNGIAQGKLIGGNLSMLHNMIGTPYEFEYGGNILILEEVDEYVYHVDRMLQHLNQAGRLKHLAGLVVGSFSKMKDNDIPFGMDVKEIINSIVDKYDFPVAFDFPIGHESLNHPWIVGRNARLSVDSQTASLSYTNNA